MLYGGNGDELFYGGDGNDYINGGDGDDDIVGDYGNDTLTGGTGADKFIFGSPADGIDTITGFNGSQGDKIQVVDDRFGDLTLGPLSDAQFTIGSAATDASVRFIYNSSSGGLFFDSDGTGSLEQVQLAGQLSVQDGSVVRAGTLGSGQGGNLTVTAEDFVELIGTGTSPEGLPARSGLFTETQGAGDAGDLTITTRRLSVGDGAVVSASTSAEGGGGNLFVTASDSVNLFGRSGLFTQTQGAGAAGDLTIATRDLIVENGAVVSAFSSRQGDGGDMVGGAVVGVIVARKLLQMLGGDDKKSNKS